MSTRHSFLSTTGLLRPISSTSLASTVPSIYSVQTPPEPMSEKTSSRFPRFKNLKKLKLPLEAAHKLRPPTGGVIPLGPKFIVGIGVIMSLFFIGALSFAFIGGEDEPVFQTTLDGLAKNSPGFLLIADNVDVDIDEPSVGLRWSLVGCGANFTLPGSEGTHGSSSCGIPNVPLNIYIDGEETPTAIFSPAQLPFTSSTGHRLGIQNIYQFDSDHVLDVHEARLYPFDTYILTTTIRAVDAITNETVPITRLLTITDTSSFIISPSDSASYIISSANTDEQSPSRDLVLNIARPGEARFFALTLFGINWMLAHTTVAYVGLAWKTAGSETVLRYLIFCLITLLAIPGVRNTMPDAPGYDGVLIDQIGFFAQMLLSGISTIVLLATLAKRELQHLEDTMPVAEFVKERPAPISKGLHKLRGSSTSVDFRHIRSLSKSFMATVEPPTPIPERPEPRSSHFQTPAKGKGKGKAVAWDHPREVANSSTSSFLDSTQYARWV